MSDAELDEDSLEQVPNPLSVELDQLQLSLLSKIFAAVYDLPSARWPLWDWVSREFSRDRPEYIDAAAVWRSLPRVPAAERTDEYGLVWSLGMAGGTDPRAEDRVGLTIAGLVALGRGLDRPSAEFIADDLARKVGDLSREEQALTSDPDTVASATVEIKGPLISTGLRLDRSGEMKQVHQIGEEIPLHVLQKEYAQLGVYINPGLTAGHLLATASLGPWLRRFREVQGAEDYLEILARDQQVQHSAPLMRPDELALMLDHTSYVLKDRPDWEAEAMARPRDYRTAAALMLPAHTAEEFQARTSDLWNVLSDLKIPEMPVKDPSDGSLKRLQRWLEGHISDETSRNRAVEAVEDVRCVGALRNYSQHPHGKTRRNVIAACARLGLPYPVRDWAAAWDHLRAKVADAFYVLGQEGKG